MATVERLYVDANIFIRLFEGNDELAAALATLFLTGTASSSEPFLATSELTLAEVLVTPYREKNERLIQVYDNWTVSNSYLEVGPIDRQVLWYAAVARAKYRSLRLPDAIHLSTALGMRCSHFLSADKRLGDKFELTHARYGLIKGPVSIDIVRPETSFIEALVRAMEER